MVFGESIQEMLKQNPPRNLFGLFDILSDENRVGKAENVYDALVAAKMPIPRLGIFAFPTFLKDIWQTDLTFTKLSEREKLQISRQGHL